MKIIILLFTSIFSHALDVKEAKIRKDLHIDQGFYEPVEETIKGPPDACPTGLVALRNHENSYQLWVGDRFYISNINEGDVQLEYEGMNDCHEIQNVVTGKRKITKLNTRYCQLNKKTKDRVKDFESKIEIAFTKGYIDYSNTVVYFDKNGKEIKTSSAKCTSKKYIKSNN